MKTIKDLFTLLCSAYLLRVDMIKELLEHRGFNNVDLIIDSLRRVEIIGSDGFLHKEKITEDSIKKVKQLLTMNIDVLKTGMWVELANGQKFMILRDGLDMLVNARGYMRLSMYTHSSLKHLNDPNYNIIKVYHRPGNAFIYSAPDEQLKLLWARKSETVLSMQEIADKFGIPVEQLRIKE